MVDIIGTPMGLSKAGVTGCGGDYIPLKSIRKDFFDQSNMIYAIKFVSGESAPHDAKSVIIDIIYDNYTMSDPHSARPMDFVTDYQNDPTKEAWFGTFKAPNAGKKYGKVGMHTVTIKVAPRKAPEVGTASATETLPLRDFSEAAGGVIKTFTFEIYPTSESIRDLDD
jgi:hypothetical protein